MVPVRTVDTAAAAGGRNDASGTFDLPALIMLARKRAPLIQTVALCVVGLTLVVLLLLPTLYTASAVVMLDPRKNTVAGLSAVLTEQPTDPASVQNQIQILTSRDLAGEVIQQLGLADDPEFNAALAPSPLDLRQWLGGRSAESQYSSIIDGFLKHLSVDALGLSTAMSVRFESRDPSKAARIVNAITDAYIRSQAEVNAEVGHRTTAWLVQRIRELARQVQIAESDVERYKAENAINDAGDGTGSVVDQQMSAINTQLVQARADLAAKQANYDRIATLLKSGDAADVSQVVSSPLIIQLRTQQSDAIRDEAELASRYGPKHPKRVAAESQLHDLQLKIDQEVGRIAGSVSNDVAVARAQVGSLQASLTAAEARDNDQNLARVRLKALESDAASTRTMYESFVGRLRETQGQDAVQVSDARIISHASVPSTPSSPKRLIIFAASIPVGILLGLLSALVAERLHASQRPAGTGSPFRVPVLAEVRRGAMPRAADDPSSDLARAMRAFAAQIAHGPRTIALTSFDPRDGQSNVAVGLSRALARVGRRVVLIDAHPPMTYWTLGVPAPVVGIGEVLNGALPLVRALARDPRSNALLLSAPAGQVWQSPRIGELMTSLLRSADVIIIDAPPVGSAELALIVPFAQGMIAVCGKSANAMSALADVLGHWRRGPAGIIVTV
jgi:uncharacterized protein involved in exopolysaccharide biosynthesis/Mrp family chromosome partitioning ATPase